MAGLNSTESAIVALAALTFLILYNAVSMRLRDRTDVGSQIADLSRGTADLARQVAEFGRRMTSIEVRLIAADTSGQERVNTVSDEIGELGSLLKQLADSVATHDEILADVTSPNAAKTSSFPQTAPDVVRRASPNRLNHPKLSRLPSPLKHRPRPANVNNAQMLVAVKNAIEANRSTSTCSRW